MQLKDGWGALRLSLEGNEVRTGHKGHALSYRRGAQLIW